MTNGQIYSNSAELKASLNGLMEQNVTDTGLKLEGLKAGLNNLQLREEGKTEPRETSIDVSKNPGLIVLIGTPNIGTLKITESNNVEATVRVESVDNKLKPVVMTLKNGVATLQLEPKDYIVTLSAGGYETETVSPVRITREKVEPVTRTLKPLPTVATLEIRGGTPDAELYLDGRSLGNLNSNGDFTSSQISPAKHRIELRKDNFEPRTASEAEFIAGGKISISGPAATLTAFGTLSFEVTPPISEITYQAVGESSGHKAKPGDRVSLKQGRYTVSIIASNFISHSNEAYTVTPGDRTVVKVDLTPIAAADPGTDSKSNSPLSAAPKPKSKEILSDMKSSRDNTILCSAPYCFSSERTAGTYAFKVKLGGGNLLGGALFTGKQARWVVDYVDSKNFTEYEIDDKNIKYTVTKNGKKQQTLSNPHSLTGSDGFFDLIISVAIPSKLVVVSSGGKFGKSLISSPIDDPSAGKFAFAKDVTIADFSFTPAK
jgi:hypothetical protein